MRGTNPRGVGGAAAVGTVALIAAACVGPACARARAKEPAGRATNPLVAARPYRITTPAALDPQRSYPLVVALHGLGGDGERIEKYFELDALVDELGFLVVYPEGTRETRKTTPWGRYRRFWNATDACCDRWHSGVDDVAYLDAVIDDVSARYRVDAKRVFLMGISNGGYMSYRYACDRANRVAAIASQAGAMWRDTGRCKPSAPVAVLQIHGTQDGMVPYDVPPSDDSQPTPGGRGSVADWVTFDGCRPAADKSSPPMDLAQDENNFDTAGGAETTIEKWTGCRGVELWTIHGGSHVPHLNQPFFARTVYGWLAAHPKP